MLRRESNISQWLRFVVLVGLGGLGNAAPGSAADDGRRKVDVPRFGITVRVPQAWRLITWARNDEAFVLKLPQDAGSKSGYVSCTLGIAPENLAEYQRRIARRDELERDEPAVPLRRPERDAEDGPPLLVRRRLLENEIEPLSVARFGPALVEQLGQRLVSVFEITPERGNTMFEMVTRVVHDGSLYTFTLATDEAHFDAYRADFDDMLVSAELKKPETGLQRMPGGYWMQRDFRFALRLPDGWRPAFGPDDKVLFFATGKTHEVFTANLIVLASPPRALDLPALKTSLPEQVAKLDDRARVVCQIVPQGGASALETEIHTERGPLAISILERRFSSQQRTYEVKFTCLTAEFEQLAAQFRAALDSFVEVLENNNGAT